VVGPESETVSYGQSKPELDKLNIKRTAAENSIALICKSAQDGGDVASIAELYLQDSKGKRLSREPWTVKYTSSEDLSNGNNTGDKVYDLQESTYWSTAKGTKYPHIIVIDLGEEQTFSALEYLPRAEQGAPGSVKEYEIKVKR
jgi:beta-galactosidase